MLFFLKVFRVEDALIPDSVVCCDWQALTVLEFLVANGAERVIDELQEHTYQIQVHF